MSAPLLIANDLTLRFGGVTALAGVSFTVDRGEIHAIIGPNGAGKSSLLNCLSGFYRPRQGEVTFDGTSVLGCRPPRIAGLGIARTFQNLGLFDELDLVENLMLGRHQLMRSGFVASMVWLGRARREEREHRRAVEAVIARLRLEEHAGRPVRDLPYGVRKRIELGRAVATEPSLLLLDEPAAGLNAAETAAMTEDIARLCEDGSLTVILIEHDMTMVMALADQVTVLDFGVVIASGAPEVVREDPKVVAAYLGTAEDMLGAEQALAAAAGDGA